LTRIVVGEVLGQKLLVLFTAENFRISKPKKSQQKIVPAIRSSVATEIEKDLDNTKFENLAIDSCQQTQK
jgi:hypothetical protein